MPQFEAMVRCVLLSDMLTPVRPKQTQRLLNATLDHPSNPPFLSHLRVLYSVSFVTLEQRPGPTQGKRLLKE